MAEGSNYKKKYGLTEIERYYSGKMLPQEMHDLEKTALEDSFLADAMEGFTHTSTAGTDVADLKNKLKDRQHNGLIVPLNKKKSYSQIFRAAALLLLMIGVGWLVYELSFNKQSNDISYSPETHNAESSTDSTQLIDNISPAEQKPITGKALDRKRDIDNTRNNSKNAENTIKQNKQIGTVERIDNATSSQNGNDATSQSVSMAPDQQVVPMKQESNHDSAQRSLRSTPMMAESQNNEIVVGYAKSRKPDTKNNGNQVIITTIETEDGINEVMLQLSRKDSLHKKAPKIVIEEAEPEESWSKFGEYISDNLPDELQNDSINGTVKVSFEINSSGEPVKMEIEKSLCEKCDAEALRILKEGPKWKRKTKKGKVSFMF